MPSTPINTVVTYEGKLAKDLFFAPVLALPQITDQGIKIIEDIQSRLYVFYNSKLDKVTKANPGCSSAVTGTGTAITRELIQVTDLEIFLSQCYTVFDQTLYEAARKKGMNIADLTGTEIETLLKDTLLPTIERDMQRIAWLADTSMVGDVDYGMLDGLFVKIAAGVTAGDIENVTTAVVTTPALAFDVLNRVYFNQKDVMKAIPLAQKRFLVTRDIFDNYVQYLSTLGTDEISHTNLVNGISAMKFMGIEVVAMDLWTEYLAADFAAEDQSRVILLVKDEALVIGVDASSDTTQVDFWYEKKDKLNYTRVDYKLGTFIKHTEFLSVANFGNNSN